LFDFTFHLDCATSLQLSPTNKGISLSFKIRI
jgi:hypothetical protein